MRRFSEERALMLGRLREDIQKHKQSGTDCNCTPGRFRKHRVLECPAGGKTRCSTCSYMSVDKQNLARFKARRAWNYSDDGRG